MSDIPDHKISKDKYKEIGILLSSKRNELSIEIDDVAKSLKVSPQYIAMIEDGDYKGASKAIYYHGCVGAMCRFFDMNDVKVLDYLLTSSVDPNDHANYLNRAESKSDEISTTSIHTKVAEVQKSHTKLVYKVFIVLNLILFAIYSFSKAKN